MEMDMPVPSYLPFFTAMGFEISVTRHCTLSGKQIFQRLPGRGGGLRHFHHRGRI